MKVADYLVFDIETGGLNYAIHGLCELAAVVVDSDTLEEVDRYEAIIAPYHVPNPDKDSVDKFILSTYTQEALNINRLTVSQIENGVPAKQAVQDFAKFCKTYAKGIKGGGGKVIPVGHNILKFDIPYVDFFFDIHKLNLSDFFNSTSIDTMWWSRFKNARDGSVVNHTLTTACENAGIKLIDGHRAMKDVESNADLLRHYIRNLRGDKQEAQLEVKKRFREEFKFD